MKPIKNDINIIIKNTIESIISVIPPVKIFLFGSAIKDSFVENSDLDFLVVVKNGISKRKTTSSIYRKLIDIGFATDIIIITEDEFVKYKDENYYIINTAVTEGKLVYG